MTCSAPNCGSNAVGHEILCRKHLREWDERQEELRRERERLNDPLHWHDLNERLEAIARGEKP